MDSSPTAVPGPAALKALSHPVRLQILGLLRSEGPATATSLAQRLGLNSGATSYHLRQLHQHGFVTEDTERGNARERWWRAAHMSTRTDRADHSPENAEAREAFAQAVATVHAETTQRALAEAATLPERWREASTTSDWTLRLTPERADELVRTLAELLSGWAEDDLGTEDGADFVVQLHAFPRPGVLEPEDRA